MLKHEKEMERVTVRKFAYKFANNEYIVEAETNFCDVIGGDLHEFYLHRVGLGIKMHIVGIPAKSKEKDYTLEEALELVEYGLDDDIFYYEEEIEYLENMEVD